MAYNSYPVNSAVTCTTEDSALATPKSTPTRERILEAAERCLERYGVEKTTLADVAKEAGVARVTVYRQFADRNALFVDTSLHIFNRRWQVIAGQLCDVEDPAEWMLQALLINRKMIEKERSEGRYQQRDVRMEGMAIALSPPGLNSITVHLAPLMSKHPRALAQGVKVEDLAEWLHWQSFVIDSQVSQRLKTDKQWRRWLEPQIRGGFLRP